MLARDLEACTHMTFGHARTGVWEERPMDGVRADYASQDVCHLLNLHNQMVRALKAAARDGSMERMALKLSLERCEQAFTRVCTQPYAHTHGRQAVNRSLFASVSAHTHAAHTQDPWKRLFG